MSPANTSASTVIFKPRSAKWFAFITWTLVAVGLIASAVADGINGLIAAWPLLVVAYFGWWAFWYPSVQVGHDGITVHNLLRSVSVPWSSLINVDTKFALTLVTTKGKFTAWAAPAPGVWGTHAGKPEHVRGLPATTYGPADSIRPGDLKNTDSGAAAFHVRTQWSALAETGQLDIDSPEATHVTKPVHWFQIGGAAALLAGCFIAFAMV